MCVCVCVCVCGRVRVCVIMIRVFSTTIYIMKLPTLFVLTCNLPPRNTEGNVSSHMLSTVTFRVSRRTIIILR